MRPSVWIAIVLAACSGKTLTESSDAGQGGNGSGGLPSFGGGTNAGGSGGTPSGGFGSYDPTGGGGGPIAGGGTGGTPLYPRVGRACAADAECGDGLFCAKANSKLFGGESPSKGYCTADCTTNAAICKTSDPTATCFSFDDITSYCLETCDAGPPGTTQFDPDKCHGRQEVACSPVFPGPKSALCLPQCNSDYECGSGQSCNPKTGLCTTSTASGLPIGSPCSPWVDGGPEFCAGLCSTLESTLPGAPVPACTQACTLGATPSCGWLGPGTGPAPAACLYSAPGIEALGGPGIGDLGYCGKLCDCDDECLAEYECLPWSGPDAQAFKDFFQRVGYCGVNQVGGDAAVTPCGN